MRRTIISIAFWLAGFALGGTVTQAEEEREVSQWNWKPLWSEEADAGTVAKDEQVRHNDTGTTRIEHRGNGLWSREPDRRIDAHEGDIFELSALIKLDGTGEASAGVVTYGADGQVVRWNYSRQTARPTADWQLVQTRLVVPQGVTAILPRLTGLGPVKFWLGEFKLRKTGNLAQLRGKMPDELKLENQALSVVFDSKTATFAVTDRRTGQTWSQQPLAGGVVVTGAQAGKELELKLFDVVQNVDFHATARLDGELPEMTVTLSGQGPLPGALAFPQPFVTATNTYLVVPMNEGMAYPVTDDSIEETRLVAYGGHGICMAFWGATDGERGQMSIFETPDDAAIHLTRQEGKLAIAPEWDSQKGQFGYERKLRYVFFDHGGHVAMCKRYRAFARKEGLLKTLAEKRRENANVDLLIGAVNVWCWEPDAPAIVREMKAAGVERILWSAAAHPDILRTLNDLGVLTSRYDIYQDVMDPAVFPWLKHTHPDWVTAAWPKDLMIGWDGNWIRGWEVEDTNKQMHACGVVCDQQALQYADKRVSEELKDHPYRCRFIDTTTASSWRECYDPAHPLTRTESRHWKMELLRLMSEKFKLVTASETGHDAAVPYVHYFEGMLSIAPYRVPDSGRNTLKIWDEVPERVAKFQMGERYRLPLWELVYHDCVVANWYWGDYNNKLPALWDKRDLFNILYGTPPMLMFNHELWAKNKDRFLRTCQSVDPIVRAAGYSEMMDHRFLTPDREVQQTRFANGMEVTVNFGNSYFHPAEGPWVAPHNFQVSNMPHP